MMSGDSAMSLLTKTKNTRNYLKARKVDKHTTNTNKTMVNKNKFC
jgi:hypothetical protein